MVIDTSALVAILTPEPDALRLAGVVNGDPAPCTSAASVLEAAMVLEGRAGDEAGRDLDLFLLDAEIRVVPVDLQQLSLARLAFRRFGKGRHAAGLNFGDCFAYALAKQRGEPLLCKGDDFARTDIARVAY